MNIEKEKRAIQYLQSFAPADGTPYYGCYSGGKDSDAIYLPTRIARYCCSELKESGGKFRKKITGVRWDESKKRTESSGFVKVLGKPKTNKKRRLPRESSIT